MALHSTTFRNALCALMLAALAAPGCSDSGTTPGPGVNTNPTVAPKHGATYTCSNQRLDKDSAATGTSTSLVVVVTDTAATADGRSNVYEFTTGTSTWYYAYETNGDVSVDANQNILLPLFVSASTYPLKTAWFTLPVVTGTTRHDTLASTQNWNNGTISGLPLTIFSESTRTGTTTVTIGTESFAAVLLTTVLTVREASLQYRVSISWTYVPKLGFFAVHNQYAPDGFFSGGINPGGFIRVMTAHTS